MTLQQLRFLIAVAESGSINAAAQRLYTAQSNISNAVKNLEQELHLEIFTRSSRGVTLTNDGTELLGYARQVVEQADMLEARYEDGGTPQARLAISATRSGPRRCISVRNPSSMQTLPTRGARHALAVDFRPDYSIISRRVLQGAIRMFVNFLFFPSIPLCILHRMRRG